MRGSVKPLNHPLLSAAFRPMFLGLALLALVSIAFWTAALTGLLPVAVSPTSLWHAHEMLFGFALAAAAGFLLTAVAQWTGRPPVRGGMLLLLAAFWFAGRLALAVSGWSSLPTAVLAMSFPVLLVFLVAREIVVGRSRRNYPIVVLITLIAILDGAYHAGASGLVQGLDRLSVLAALYLFIVLVTVISGRIVPAFTGNWLRARGDTRQPVSSALLETLTTPMTAITGVLAVAAPGHLATSAAALGTAALHAARLARWRGFAVRSDPLLLVLHVAYAWLPAGFFLLAICSFNGSVPLSSVLHAFGVGVIGTMILAVTSRVSLGHTGRPLSASRVTAFAYVLLTLAAAVRVIAPMTGAGYLLAIEVAALAWMSAWLLFLWVYTPILVKPRV